MFAVIFTAEFAATLDEEYEVSASKLRARAQRLYGCLEFVSFREGDKEIAVSYWKTMADIKRWRADSEHVQAQSIGRQRWYKSYEVKIVEVLKSYSGFLDESVSPS